jgi:abhydrolase domain-containing protein 5
MLITLRETTSTYVNALWHMVWPTSRQLAEAAQRRLLDLALTNIPYTIEAVPVGKNGLTMNTVIAGNGPPLVLLHGWGSGTALFYRNIGALSQHYTVYAVDLLGCGLSSRPSWRSIRTADAAESFFVSSLEEWRQSVGLDRFILCGHSMGGYVAAVYTLRNPDRVAAAVLASPVGVPKQPPPVIPSKFTLRVLRSFVYSAWNVGITPQWLLRFSGWKGPELVGKYVRHRMNILDAIESVCISDYLYHMSMLPASGEYASSVMLAPGAWAHHPLEERLQACSVPLLFLYGDNDWMDASHAQRLSPLLSCPHTISIVSQAGHHLYLDNWSHFNDLLLSWLVSHRSALIT